jgi:hypothetical protein
VSLEDGVKIRPKWAFAAVLVGLVVALFYFGYGLASLLALVLAAGWSISERWSRERAHLLHSDATEPEPGTPFERHRP